MRFCNLLSIIIPAYNEAESLKALYQRTLESIPSNQPFEFIVINDGSTDNTVKVLREMENEHPNIITIHLSLNCGKSVALMQGFEDAQGDIAIILDADLQDIPEHIPNFLEKINEGYDLVNGWRHKRTDGPAKKFVSIIFNILTNLFLKISLHDINCGFKAIRKHMYKNIELVGDMHRIIPAIVIGLGGKVTEIKINHIPRIYGASKYSLFRHRGLLDILSFLGSSATRWSPFHAFSEIAFLIFVCGVATLGFAFYFSHGLDISNATSLFILFLLGGTGFLLIFFSMILPVFGITVDIHTQQLNKSKLRKSIRVDTNATPPKKR